MSETTIAKRIRIHRTTVAEHLEAAEKKMKNDQENQRVRKRLAKVKPTSTG